MGGGEGRGHLTSQPLAKNFLYEIANFAGNIYNIETCHINRDGVECPATTLVRGGGEKGYAVSRPGLM